MRAPFSLSSCLFGLASLIVSAAPAPAQSDQLIAPGAVWSYLDDGSDQGTAWTAIAFDDSLWASGPAELGYGDGDESTVVGFGGDPNDKHITTYFRHEFVVPDASVYVGLSISVLRDDGAVVFLNGVELLRSNMTISSYDYLTRAGSTISDSEELIFYPVDVASDILVDDTNVLAVEIHQRSPTSSDISFDLELVAHRDIQISRGPYLQQGTDTGVTVRWRTVPATDTWLWYGDSPGNLVNVVSIPGITTEHEVELTNLDPDTTCYYAVGWGGAIAAGDDAQHFVRTHPTPGSDERFRVWILGDSGTADDSARAVRDAYESFTANRHTNLVLMLGDNAYPFGTDSEYQAAVFDMYPDMLKKSVLWPTRGNHEAIGATYYDMFTMPTAAEAGGVASGTEAYYSFDYANAHFICLDSEGSDRSVGGAMWNWLQADLAATTQEWVIAFWHHPPYSKGSHNSNTETRLITMRQNFLPLLESGGVDLVFCGHSHSYERSFLLDGHYGPGGTLTPEMVVDGGSGQEENDGAYNKVAGANRGAVYTVAGSSGKTSSGPLNHPAMFTSQELLGSVVLDFDGGRLDATFLRSTGAESDHWTFLSETYVGSYCAAPPSSEGCIAQMSAVGKPSATAPSPYFLNAGGVPNNKTGLLFYGFGPNNIPFYNGRLCVKGPLARTQAQNSGSGPLPCTGSFTYDFNQRIQSGIDGSLLPGETVYTQYWFRDPVGEAALSDGYQFSILP